MQHTDKPAFKDLITDVMAYYGKDCSAFVLTLWWDACQGVTLEQVQKALNAHAMDAERGVFAPKVADIVRTLQGTSTDRATLAWGKVLSAISAVGAYQDVVFDDPAIHAAITDCGGWQKVCRGEMAELSYLQHRFCQSHKAYVERGDFEYPRCLTGDRSPDSEYLKYGRKPPKPVLVGNPEKAAAVYQSGGSGGPQITFKSPIDVLALAPAYKEAA
jgi:hypothetical protein